MVLDSGIDVRRAGICRTYVPNLSDTVHHRLFSNVSRNLWYPTHMSVRAQVWSTLAGWTISPTTAETPPKVETPAGRLPVAA